MLAFRELVPPESFLQPYFGYTRVPGSPLNPSNEGKPRKRNNDGFNANINYPYTASAANEVVIGIFGGSVAQAMATAGEPPFLNTLKGLPALAGKTITILPFTREGPKQPQQLTELAYYLAMGQKFDIVIEIDEFNEIVYGAQLAEHGYEEGLPSPGLMR